MKFYIVLFVVLSQTITYSQSDIEKLLKSGEIIINGLSFLKVNKIKTDSKFIESVCVKNKLSDKIMFSLIGKDDEGNQVKKDMVVQKDSRECVFDLPKGIYTYEILLSNKDIFKKGEYKLEDEITITVKNE